MFLTYSQICQESYNLVSYTVEEVRVKLSNFLIKMLVEKPWATMNIMLKYSLLLFMKLLHDSVTNIN